MKRQITIGMALLAALAARAGFAPIALTPDSYTVDMIVEKAAPGIVFQMTTATMDQGTNNGADTWYEIGYNTASPNTGIPKAGTPFASLTKPNRMYSFAPNYTNNNVVLLDSSITNATFTFTTPAPYGVLSVLTSGGNGGCGFNWTAHYADGTSQTGAAFSPDWFSSDPGDVVADGRIRSDFVYENVGSGYPRLYARDFVLSKTDVAVTSLELTFTSSQDGAHTMFTCVSGGTTTDGAFSPIDVTGYNYDGIVEASGAKIGPMGATTATMDNGTGNTGATWYEQGFDPRAPTTGLPAPGTLLTNAIATDHVFKLPADYTINDAALVDANSLYTTLTLATPARYTALSILLSSGGGAAPLQYTVNYVDGSTESGSFTAPDWYNGTAVFIANGRVGADTGIPDTVNGNNPRIYSQDIALTSASGTVASLDITWNGASGNSAHVCIFALSGTAGAVKPIINPQPQSMTVSAGDSPQLTITASGTSPFTYFWQKSFSSGTNAVFTNLTDTAIIGGSKTDTLKFTGITVNESANYQVVVHNSAGYVTSLVATVTVISPLQDVCTAGDPLTGFGGTWPDGENPNHVIDHLTSKYLNYGMDNTGFIVSPSIGLTVVSGMRFYTANDSEGRDPASYILEGSLDGTTYTTISSGPLALPAGRNGSGTAIDPTTQFMQQVLFSNTKTYASYRVTFPNVKDETANMMQIGEVEILGTLDTSGRPHFTALPAAQSVYVGGTITLTATAAGTPAPTYQWRRGTAGVYTDVVDGGNISGAKTSTLTITGATFGDAVDYVVVASNTVGSLTGSPTAVGVLTAVPNVLSTNDVITGFGNLVRTSNTDPTNAIDGTTSKYVNIGHGGSATAGFGPFQGPVGLEITPAAGATVVSGIRIFTADGGVITDPADYALEGSTDGGTTYAAISSGALSLPTPRNASGTNIIDPLTQFNQEILFVNHVAYTTYRVTFNNVKDDRNAADLEIAELQLLGIPAGEAPANLTIVNNGDGSATITTTKPGELWSTAALSATPTWADVGAITDTLKVQIGANAKFFRLVVQ